jgi:hypothetical protein
MAIIALTPNVVAEAGTAAIYTAPTTTDTYTFRNNGRTMLHVKKSGANPCNVTIVPAKQVAGHTLSSLVVAIPATTGDKFIGPFNQEMYDDGNHDVSVTFSEITGLTVAVVQLPEAVR